MGDGFVEMLLTDFGEGEGDNGDESKSYWTSILDLVNSASPLSSPTRC